MNAPLTVIMVAAVGAMFSFAAIGVAAISGMARNPKEMEHVYGTMMIPVGLIGIVAIVVFVLASIVQFA